MKKQIATLMAALLLLMLCACGGKAKAPAHDNQSPLPTTASPAPTEAPKAHTTPAPEEAAPEAPAPEQQAEPVDGMRPEFKEAMDSYEAFYDQYCSFMKQYSENPTDMSLLAEYGTMLLKLEEMNQKFDAWEEDDLNKAEAKYYLEVSNRISQKLLDVVQ